MPDKITKSVVMAGAQNANIPKATKDMRLIVVDSTGAEVGIVVDVGSGPDIRSAIAVALASDGRVASFEVTPETVEGAAQLWYQSSDCTGTPFLLTSVPSTLIPRTAFNPPGRRTLYIEQLGATTDSQVLESNREENGACNQETRSSLAVPATSTGLDFNRFIPPFRLVFAPRN